MSATQIIDQRNRLTPRLAHHSDLSLPDASMDEVPVTGSLIEPELDIALMVPLLESCTSLRAYLVLENVWRLLTADMAFRTETQHLFQSEENVK